MHLLIIEANEARRVILLNRLLQFGHQTIAYSNALPALDHVSGGQYVLAVVNRRVPDMDGLRLLHALKRLTPQTLILSITASAAAGDTVSSLDAGADDVIAEPYALPELEARVRALLRRRDDSAVVRIGPLVIDPRKSQLWIGETSIESSPADLLLLRIITRKVGHIVSKGEIAHQLRRGGDTPSATAIEIRMHRLRKLLEPYGLKFRTVRGVGYALESPLGTARPSARAN